MVGRKRPRRFLQSQESPTFRRIFLAVYVSCWVLETGFGQFPSAAPCPDAAQIQGYTSVADINSDMAEELREIVEENKPQNQGGYDYLLCPSTTLDVGDPLLPVLDNVRFICGENGAVTDQCILSGGSQQIVIQNPENVDNSFVFNLVSFVGVTFENFSQRSLSLEADAPLQASFLNCVWQVSWVR